MSIQRPTKCNICGGKVSYVPSSFIYGQGRSYGSGFAYWCRKLAGLLGISYKHCHFSWFDKDRLREAIRILEEEWDDEDQ